MKTLITIALLSLALRADAQQVIAQDPEGMVVEVKEKYGPLLVDTATVVMFHNNHFVLVKREGKTGWFPSSFHSVRIIERLGDNNKQLASADNLDFEQAPRTE